MSIPHCVKTFQALKEKVGRETIKRSLATRNNWLMFDFSANVSSRPFPCTIPLSTSPSRSQEPCCNVCRTPSRDPVTSYCYGSWSGPEGKQGKQHTSQAWKYSLQTSPSATDTTVSASLMPKCAFSTTSMSTWTLCSLERNWQLSFLSTRTCVFCLTLIVNTESGPVLNSSSSFLSGWDSSNNRNACLKLPSKVQREKKDKAVKAYLIFIHRPAAIREQVRAREYKNN